jgi:eukaryotic translation initiation factor 2C
VRLGKDAVYPAEVCEIIPGQIYKKKLEPSEMTEFLALSTMKPFERMNNIGQAVRNDVSTIIDCQNVLILKALWAAAISQFALDERSRFNS